jgi:hypothetical protein
MSGSRGSSRASSGRVSRNDWCRCWTHVTTSIVTREREDVVLKISVAICSNRHRVRRDDEGTSSCRNDRPGVDRFTSVFNRTINKDSAGSGAVSAAARIRDATGSSCSAVFVLAGIRYGLINNSGIMRVAIPRSSTNNRGKDAEETGWPYEI